MSVVRCALKLVLLCGTASSVAQLLATATNKAYTDDAQCDPGYYGRICNLSCPRYCKNQICDKASGSCTHGCRPDLIFLFSGDRCCVYGGHCKICENDDICAECLDGFYGTFCHRPCLEPCADGKCDKVDGRCKSECKDGSYGTNCKQICPRNCKNEICDNVTGSCTQGCQLGYTGDSCCLHLGYCKVCENNNICAECLDGFYGEQCDIQCPGGCLDEACEKGDGGCKQKCKDGHYGMFCNQTCPHNCKNKKCDKVSGSCTQGCVTGYSGDKCCLRLGLCKVCENNNMCAECLDGFYGEQCDIQCPARCLNGICEKGNGRCKQECKGGYYGDYCTQRCPLNCKDYICDKGNGSCNHGCRLDQYSGDKCCLLSLDGHGNCKTCSLDNECAECMGGFYGKYCSKRCSRHCDGTVCNRTMGTCSEGCDEGYTGDMCCISGGNCHQCTSSSECKTCQTGYFGEYCKQTCSPGCRGDDCDKTRGHCSNGCRVGFTGDKCCQKIGYCNTCKSNYECGVCQTGYFGQNCHEKCSIGCRLGTCDRKNGSCKCKEGYSGDKCCVNNNNCRVCSSTTQCSECKSKFHGNDCELTCPKQCFSDTCDKQHGTCSRCKKGYYGGYCSKTCPINCFNNKCRMDSTCYLCSGGFHGPNCSKSCSRSCLNDICNINGYCMACKDGFYGTQCETSCHSNCLTCLSENQCTKCKNGFHGEDCSFSCPSDCVNCTNGGHCSLCKPGYYGDTCRETCSLCKTGTACRQSDGYCLQACKDGFSSGDCSLRCPSNCRSCYPDYANYCTACSEGRFGKWYTHWLYSQQYSYCDNQCSTRCLHGMCDERTGHCLNCTGNFHGDLCDTCLEPLASPDKDCSCKTDVCLDARSCSSCRNVTWYSDAQSRSCCPCSNTCRNNTCSGEDACTHGCVDGYYGVGCKLKCSARQEGCEKCSLNDRNRYVCEKCRHGVYPRKNHCTLCSESCLNATCDPTNGRCTASCTDGRWGARCGRRCRQYCSGGICDRDSGNCTAGCVAGHWGRMCNKICGRHCVHNTCDRKNGHCIEGCEKGHWGESCNGTCVKHCEICENDTECMRCEAGRYLTNCSSLCSLGCVNVKGRNVCDINDGTCVGGCSDERRYGKQCDTDCSKNCTGSACEWLTGKCSRGCVYGFYGELCNTKCADTCMSVANGATCIDTNGTCVAGCSNGYYGDTCRKECNRSCTKGTCDRETGTCTRDCLPGHIGANCSKGLEQLGPDSTSVNLYVGAAIGGVLALLLVVAGSLAVFFMRRRKRRASGTPEADALANTPSQNVEMAQIDHAYVNIFGSGIREADRRVGGATREGTPVLEELRTKLATVGNDTDPGDSTYDQPDQIAPPGQSTYEQVNLDPPQGTLSQADPDASIYEQTDQDLSQPTQSTYEQLDRSIHVPERTYGQLYVQPGVSTYENPIQNTTQPSQSTYEQLDREHVGRDTTERTYEQLDIGGDYVNAGSGQLQLQSRYNM